MTNETELTDDQNELDITVTSRVENTAEDLLELTVEQLREVAAAADIDLIGVTRKADIVDVIVGGVDEEHDEEHFGPVLDQVLADAEIPVDRVLSRMLTVYPDRIGVGWLDSRGTCVGRYVLVTAQQSDQIREELGKYALRGLDTLADTARDHT